MAEIRAVSLRLLDFAGMVTDGEKAMQACKGMRLYKNYTVGCGPEPYAA